MHFIASPGHGYLHSLHSSTLRLISVRFFMVGRMQGWWFVEQVTPDLNMNIVFLVVSLGKVAVTISMPCTLF